MSRKRDALPHVRVVRNPPRTRWTRLACWLQDAWQRLLGAHALWIVLYLAIGTWALLPRLELPGGAVEDGDIAGRDYIATREVLVPDETTTAERRRRERDKVLQVYDYDPAFAREVDETLARLFSTARLWLAQGVPMTEGEAAMAGSGTAGEGEAEGDIVDELITQLQETSGARLDRAAYVQLVAEGFSPGLEEALRSIAAETFRAGIVANKELLLEHRARGVTVRNLDTRVEQVQFNLFDYLGYPDEVKLYLGSQLRRVPGLSSSQRTVLQDFLAANTTPNVFSNQSATLQRREEAGAATAPVFHQIQRGQVIARKGDRLDEGQVRAIASLRGDHSLSAQLLPLLGNVLLLGLGALLLWTGLDRERFPHKSQSQLFGESLILLSIMLVMARLGFWIAEGLGGHSFGFAGAEATSYLYAIPLASLGVSTALLYGRGMALLVTLVYSVLIARVAGAESLILTVYTLAGSLAGIYAVDRIQIKQRFALARIGMVVGLVNLTTIITLTTLFRPQRVSPDLLGFDLLCGLAGGLAVAATASFLTPILEGLFSVTTDLRLVELSNTNLPLLRRLAFEAPGSFQHSLMVANLAKAGASAVDADPTLAYTGGLYHDIGKIFRPEYFIENQHPGKNPHDKLSPSMSTLVLVSHIKDGVDLARQHRIPRVILDAIEQHHGTALIKFFYQRALDQREDDSVEVLESEFRYPGPKPQTRVMGILMLADGVEAASRTLRDPTPMTIREVIRKIFEVCIQDGQLDETDLTLSDLSRISDAFFQVLSNIFHRRVDYPGFDFGDRQPRPAEEPLPAANPSQARP
jgi:putative nucleotidyltransferase with HDIG domain